MLRKTINLIILLMVTLSISSLIAADEKIDPFKLVEKTKVLSENSLWSGFDPGEIPLAIFDGTDTYLYGHPSVPADFEEIINKPGFYRFSGRHEAVVANSSSDIAGVRCATVMLDLLKNRPLSEAAAVVIHEKFHVFQAGIFKKWGINEAEGFTYPMADVDQNLLFALEAEALARALESASEDDALSWTKKALELRNDRIKRLGSDTFVYDRNVEAIEGTATYIEKKSIKKQFSPDKLRIKYDVLEVRRRCYATGAALAALLDRFNIKWQEQLSLGDISLDELLSGAVKDKNIQSGKFSESTVSKIKIEVESDVDSYKARLSNFRKDFEKIKGYRVEIVAAAGKPLGPKGFDPMNVVALNEKELLHNRFIVLGNSSGSIEVMQHVSLTKAAGDHILFSGVKEIIVSGIENKPEIEEKAGELFLESTGLKLKFKKAKYSIDGMSIKIELQ